jgi:oligopeptide/dipeptide ABC transporter ATP-binding protein
VELLEAVSIPDPQRRVRDYPHQLSGGLRQRALIALALSCNPALLIADEPTTALDVTIQAQILDLLRDLQRRLGLGLLLITHDLGVVAEMADRVAVMYAGRIVEEARVRDLFRDPRHPYTRGLLGSMPGGARGARLQAIQGTVPPLGQLPPGCPFSPRCPKRFEPCDDAPPGFTVVRPPEGGSHTSGEGGEDPRGVRLQVDDHTARCYLYSPAVEPQVLPESGPATPAAVRERR